MHAGTTPCAPLGDAVAAALLSRAVLLLGAAWRRAAEGVPSVYHTVRALTSAGRKGRCSDGSRLRRASQLRMAQPLLLGLWLDVPAGKGHTAWSDSSPSRRNWYSRSSQLQISC